MTFFGLFSGMEAFDGEVGHPSEVVVEGVPALSSLVGLGAF